jgi:hypothetical protein
MLVHWGISSVVDFLGNDLGSESACETVNIDFETWWTQAVETDGDISQVPSYLLPACKQVARKVWEASRQYI